MNIVALSGRLAADVRDHYTKAENTSFIFRWRCRKVSIKMRKGNIPSIISRSSSGIRSPIPALRIFCAATVSTCRAIWIQKAIVVMMEKELPNEGRRYERRISDAKEP